MARRKRYENNIIAGLNNAAVDIASGVVGKKTLSKWLGAGSNVSDEDAEKIVNTLRMGGEGDTNTYDKDSLAYKAGKVGGYAGGAYAAGGVIRSVPTVLKGTVGLLKSPTVWSSVLGGAGLLGLNEINNGGSTTNSNSNSSDDIKSSASGSSSSSGTGGSSGTPTKSGGSNTSTVSNNKTNTMQNNNPQLQQQTSKYNAPQYYDDWRNRRAANGDTYNAIFEDATNKLLANPDAFTQEQKNAIRDMGIKLGYFQDTPSAQPAAQQINDANDAYYSVQGRPQFGITL